MENTKKQKRDETRRGKSSRVAGEGTTKQKKKREGRGRARAHHERLVESVEHLSLFLSLSLSDVFLFREVGSKSERKLGFRVSVKH